MRTFSKKEALLFGWQRFKERPFFLIGLFIITTVISALSGLIADKVSGGWIEISVNVIDFSIQIILGMGITLVLLRVYDKVDTDYTDLIEPLHLFWKYLSMTILVLVVVIFGLVLFIIPGIVAAIALSFATYLVIDRNLGPVEAMKESLRITHGHRWNLFIFGLSIFFLNILGALLFGIGLLITIPVSALATVHVYRWLSNPPDEPRIEISPFAKMVSAFLLLVIIGGITVFIIAAYTNSAYNGLEIRDMQRKADLAEIKLSTASFFNDNGVYPATLEQMVPNYITYIPVDPLSGEKYDYVVYSDGVDYEVCTFLEVVKENEDGVYCEFGLEFVPESGTVNP